MGTPVIVDAVRTPLGKRKGGLAGVHPGELLGFVQTEVLKRAGVDAEMVEQIVGGCVSQAGEQSNDMVRRAWLHAGQPQHTGATTIDAQCGSGQQAAAFIHGAVNLFDDGGEPDGRYAQAVEIPRFDFLDHAL